MTRVASNIEEDDLSEVAGMDEYETAHLIGDFGAVPVTVPHLAQKIFHHPEEDGCKTPEEAEKIHMLI